MIGTCEAELRAPESWITKFGTCCESAVTEVTLADFSWSLL